MKQRTLLLAAVVSGVVLNISALAFADIGTPACYYDEECADLIIAGDGNSGGGGASSGGGTAGGGTAGGGTAGVH